MSQEENKTVSVDRRFGPKASPGRPTEPCIVFLTGVLSGKTYWLSADKELIIGRAPETDVCIQDQRVSRRHARIGITADGAILVEDLGSTNGTYVNGDKVARRALQNGDKVHIGPHYMVKFCFERNPASETSSQGVIDTTLDALTGSYTRQYLLSRIDGQFPDAKKNHNDLTLLLIDVDGIKSINDRYGESVGDMVLQQLAKLVSSTLRREDTLARYENDCFAVYPENSNESGAVVLAQRIRRAVKYHDFVHEGTKIPMTVCIGIGVLSRKTRNTLEFVSNVEAQLKRAISKGCDNINGSHSVRSIIRYLEALRAA